MCLEGVVLLPGGRVRLGGLTLEGNYDPLQVSNNTKTKRFFQLIRRHFFAGIYISSNFTEINFVLLFYLKRVNSTF